MSIFDKMAGKDIKKPEDLNPPRAPTNVMYEKSLERLEPKEDLELKDFQIKVSLQKIKEALIKGTDFDRCMIRALKEALPGVKLGGGVTRETPEVMENKLSIANTKMNMVRGLPPDVLKELKEVLKARKEVIE